MGGAKRDDHPYGIAILCHNHHNMGRPCAHDANWWGRRGRDKIKDHILDSRTPVEWKIISAYMEEKGHDPLAV